MHKTIWMPLVTIVVCAAILLGLYNGLAGIRTANAEAQLQEKMATILPGSTTFTPEEYDERYGDGRRRV